MSKRESTRTVPVSVNVHVHVCQLTRVGEHDRDAEEDRLVESWSDAMVISFSFSLLSMSCMDMLVDSAKEGLCMSVRLRC